MFFGKRCASCDMFVFIGWHQRGSSYFCSDGCRRFAEHPGFCDECRAATLDEQTGTTLFKMVGTALIGRWGRCRTCGSVETIKVFLIGVPALPLARYRMIDFRKGDGDRIAMTRRVPGPAMTPRMWAGVGGFLGFLFASFVLLQHFNR